RVARLTGRLVGAAAEGGVDRPGSAACRAARRHGADGGLRPDGLRPDERGGVRRGAADRPDGRGKRTMTRGRLVRLGRVSAIPHAAADREATCAPRQGRAGGAHGTFTFTRYSTRST